MRARVLPAITMLLFSLPAATALAPANATEALLRNSARSSTYSEANAAVENLGKRTVPTPVAMTTSIGAVLSRDAIMSIASSVAKMHKTVGRWCALDTLTGPNGDARGPHRFD